MSATFKSNLDAMFAKIFPAAADAADDDHGGFNLWDLIVILLDLVLLIDTGYPPALRDDKYTPQTYSFISLEGFINARVIVEALRRAGPNPTRVGLRQSLESLKSFDLGIGAPLNFSPERHQGLDGVYFTRVDGERWVPIADWSSAVQA